MFNPRLIPNPEDEQYGFRPREGRLSTPFIGEARIDPSNRMDTVATPGCQYLQPGRPSIRSQSKCWRPLHCRAEDHTLVGSRATPWCAFKLT